jgi:xanthine/CO dehydrogenase XdhC/CoxF family maturation factor
MIETLDEGEAFAHQMRVAGDRTECQSRGKKKAEVAVAAVAEAVAQDGRESHHLMRAGESNPAPEVRTRLENPVVIGNNNVEDRESNHREEHPRL